MSLLACKQKVWLQLAVIYTRYLLGGAFVFASLIKLKGLRFTRLNGELAPLHSPEHFFETLYRSGLYWQFLGASQLVAGLLLLTQRYALLGALLFLPIVANVFVITHSYDFAHTPLVTGAMLGATLGLLAWDANVLRALVHQPVLAAPTSALYKRRLWEGVGAGLFVYTAGYRALVDDYNFLLWAGGCGGMGLLTAGALHRRDQRALRS